LRSPSKSCPASDWPEPAFSVHGALIERAQSTLRHVVGSRLLQNLITDREEVAHEIEEILEQVSAAWGIAVESLLIKDVVFSEALQQSLSSAAQSKRTGEAKVIAARAEVDAARLMREACVFNAACIRSDSLSQCGHSGFPSCKSIGGHRVI
jgi:regulator of protease activity HflC (stomatin/prohibitin superfamily)